MQLCFKEQLFQYCWHTNLKLTHLADHQNDRSSSQHRTASVWLLQLREWLPGTHWPLKWTLKSLWQVRWQLSALRLLNARNPGNEAACSITSLALDSLELGQCVCRSCCCSKLMFVSVCDEWRLMQEVCPGRGKHNLWRDDRKPSRRGKLNLSLARRETGPQLRGQQAELTELLNRQMREASVN